MTGKPKRAQYTLEFKLEAVRLSRLGKAWRQWRQPWVWWNRRCTTG
ncbi:hypothetical protein OKW35_009986 [Paraburkholderia sp. MM5477-R1]